MSDSPQETNVEEIARELTTRRKQGRRTTLFLGSRTGGLFGNEYLYETLKQFSLLNFDTLSNIDKFRECYYVLRKHFSEVERRDILVGALATLRYREEDKFLAELIRADFFETVITTNIDSLLEDACSLLGTHFQTFVPGMGTITAAEQNNYKHNTIIKLSGDIESRRYLAPGESFDLRKNGLYEFLQAKLSSDVLMVGYDPVWDHEIEQIFPLNGGAIWYVSESEPPQHTHFDSLLKQRSGKRLLKSRGNYSSFVRTLYSSLEKEIYENPAATVPLPTLPQEPVKDKKKVFISYSHKDETYLERLTTHLKGYLYLLKNSFQLKDTVEFWDDTKISSGTDWKEEIKKDVMQAGVAIFLISANYLASKFINELPFILETAHEEKVKLFPVILDSSFPSSSERERISQLQVLNSSSNPLEWMNSYEQEVVWDKLAEQVYGILIS